MPQRQSVRRVISEPVQGADSWIDLRSQTWGEERAMAGIQDDEGKARKFLEGVIVGWNWVDYDGSPLPQVKDDPEVLLRLTGDEIRFIITSLAPDTKN